MTFSVNYPNFRVGRSKFLGAFLKQNSLLSQRGTKSELSDLILSDDNDNDTGLRTKFKLTE